MKTTFQIPGLRKRGSQQSRLEIGAPPGIEHLPDINKPPLEGTVHINCIDFSKAKLESYETDNIGEFFDQQKPEWSTTRWINVEGIHPYVINRLREKFSIHPVAAEDVLNIPQRTKIESYDDTLLLIMRMIQISSDVLINEQVSFFYFGDTLITIQERRGDVWDNVRKRLQKPLSRLRQYGTPYLLYALIDGIVDSFFPILENYSNILEDLEGKILSQPTSDLQRQIHAIKRELIVLRRVLWPTRDVINVMMRDEAEVLPEEVETYIRDVNDHATQAIDAIEIYHEMAHSLHDLYMSTVSNKMNEIMKMLTILASFFIPLTFIAGIYGMNFEHIPEMKWRYAYPAFWGICLTVIAGLTIYFRKKKWF